MTLAEQILDDLENIHFDVDEHAVSVNWNGADIVVVPEYKTGSPVFEDDAGQGVLVDRRVYYVRPVDLASPPVALEAVMIDGKRWVVEECLPMPGWYRTKLFRQRA